MATTEKRESMKIVPPGKKKCVWMEAGVVSYKICDNNYDCPTCVYDQAMQAKVAREREASVTAQPEASQDMFTQTWVDRMMKLPASQRKCRYMITGEVDRKICPNAYECGRCSFDQMMRARAQAEPLPAAVEKHTAGFELAKEAYYHEGHTWAKPEYGGRVRVGLDDFAQKLVGKVARIETPDVGHELRQGEPAFQVKRDGQTARVLSPMDGIIAKINHRLLENPELVNKAPYNEGWLFVIEPTKLRKNLKGLYYGEEAEKFLGEEKERLFSIAHEDLRVAADGGEAAEDIFSELDDEDREKLMKVFFRT
jgi:glycine cleavage system H lipoate-binding protein